MNWLLDIHRTQPVAHAIGVLSLVCLAGMALGSIKARGVGLGTAGVLFAGILTGHFGKPVDHATLEFVKEFGLVLFVFTNQASTQSAAAFLGNSLKSLNEAHFIPLFIGLALSIILGTFPVAVPGLPQPMRLGLAGSEFLFHTEL